MLYSQRSFWYRTVGRDLNMKKRNLALAFGGAVGAAVAVKLLTRDATVNWDDVSDKVVHSDHSHFVNVDGARVHYQEFGDAAKPAMILIHGYTASVYVWKTVAPMLADAGFHVIAVDLLGFGYSEKPSWFDYSIQSQARMVSRFMNRLGHRKSDGRRQFVWRCRRVESDARQCRIGRKTCPRRCRLQRRTQKSPAAETRFVARHRRDDDSVPRRFQGFPANANARYARQGQSRT